jgi:predicted dehydrogenase
MGGIGVSGPRANEHAEAYAHVERATLTAAITRNEENLKAFVERHGVEHVYTDYRKMFAEQKPDIVHVNTPPNVRVEVLEAAMEHGVSAVIFEKPIALSFEDLARIRELDAQGKCKVAVNHQLHFHPNRFSLQE